MKGGNTAFQNFLHENKPGLCVIGIILGIPSVIISTINLLHNDARNSGMYLWAYDLLGPWAFWVMIIGLLLLVLGVYYLAVFLKQLREFKGLMEINSKALFIKKQDRIEELAWRLHSRYEKQVIEKKIRLKVK